MAHIFVGVIVPGSTAFEDVEHTVKRQLAPFGDDWEIEPYKVYVNKDEISGTTRDLNIVQKELEEYYRRSLVLDERGFYYMSTYNPQAKWDYWFIGGSWNGAVRNISHNSRSPGAKRESAECRLQENMIPIDQMETIPHFFALVTPNIQWYEIGTQGVMLEYSDHDINKWKITTQHILEEHQNDIVVGIDCHS